MDEIERIWIVGAGAVGSVLAALLTRAPARRERGGRPDVILVGSSVHWHAVRESGLVFESGLPAGTVVAPAVAALDAVPALGERDLLLATGKLTRLEETLRLLRERIAPRTRILALQNGLGIDALVLRALGRIPERGLVYFGAHLPAPGRVRYFPGRIRLRDGPAARFLIEVLAGELPCETAPDFPAAEWAKLAVNCLANPLAAILRVRNAELGDARLHGIKEALLAEVRAVARAEHVPLALTAADFDAYITGATGGNTPSMAIDLQRGEPTEIDFINGAVVALAQRHALSAPVNTAIADLVRFLGPRGPGARTGAPPV